MESHTFAQVGKECTLVFWHYMLSTGAESSSLAVYKKSKETVVRGRPVLTHCIMMVVVILIRAFIMVMKTIMIVMTVT